MSRGIEIVEPQVYTTPSNAENKCIRFNSVKAVNKLAEIENEYFNNSIDGVSKYYGTVWKETYSEVFEGNDTNSLFEDYIEAVECSDVIADSMHCTIYAMHALKAGLDTNFLKFKQLHESRWKPEEYAGWSVAYILTKYFDWKAYLFISESSVEYDLCVRNYRNSKKYYVWKQPDIPLEGMFNFDNQQKEIDSLLNENEFGWGFSYQGWHTWVTRYNLLKECNWAGSPSMEFSNLDLFMSVKLTNYYAYNSHVVVFPPKRQ